MDAPPIQYARALAVALSDVARELCAGKTFSFDALGVASLKGFDDPVPLYAVGVS